ncbi:hypothetical protein [Bradyrhizobium arachidis]
MLCDWQRHGIERASLAILGQRAGATRHAAVAMSDSLIMTAAALLLAGAVWTTGLALFNIGVQLFAPRWWLAVRLRPIWLQSRAGLRSAGGAGASHRQRRC